MRRTRCAIFEGTLRVELPWASPFALGWRLLVLRIGDGESSPDSRKGAPESRNRLLTLFEVWWERELESQSLRLGLALGGGRREDLGRRFAAVKALRRRRALADSWRRRSTGAGGDRRGAVVVVENV